MLMFDEGFSSIITFLILFIQYQSPLILITLVVLIMLSWIASLKKVSLINHYSFLSSISFILTSLFYDIRVKVLIVT